MYFLQDVNLFNVNDVFSDEEFVVVQVRRA